MERDWKEQIIKREALGKLIHPRPQPSWATVRLPGILHLSFRSARPRRPSSTDPLGLSSVLFSPHAVPEVANLSSPPRRRSRLQGIAQSKPPDRPPWPLPARCSPCRPPASARVPRRSSPPSRRPRRASRSPLRAGAEDPVTEVIPVLLALSPVLLAQARHFLSAAGPARCACSCARPALV
jgi:hypothetical protein